MKSIMNNSLFNAILLFTIIGEFLIPEILKQYYREYNSKTMLMSILGNTQSPVHLIYNIWLIWLGCFLTFTAFVYFYAIRTEFPLLSILLSVSIIFFAVGAGLLSGICSINENKDIITAASKIHEVGATIGFIALLFFPLLNGVLAFKQKDVTMGIVSIISFILALIFFTCFIIGDKEQFQNTIFKYEGLWERMTLFCMYAPFIYETVQFFLSKTLN